MVAVIQVRVLCSSHPPHLFVTSSTHTHLRDVTFPPKFLLLLLLSCAAEDPDEAAMLGASHQQHGRCNARSITPTARTLRRLFVHFVDRGVANAASMNIDARSARPPPLPTSPIAMAPEEANMYQDLTQNYRNAPSQSQIRRRLIVRVASLLFFFCSFSAVGLKALAALLIL